MSTAVVAKVRVENFESWKAAYDKGEGVRREFKARGVMVVRDTTDPMLVVVITRFDSVADARAMFASDAWKQNAQRAGQPPIEVLFTDIVEEKSY